MPWSNQDKLQFPIKFFLCSPKFIFTRCQIFISFLDWVVKDRLLQTNNIKQCTPVCQTVSDQLSKLEKHNCECHFEPFFAFAYVVGSLTCSALACVCLSCATWGDWMSCLQNYTDHICMAFLQCACAYGFWGVQLVCTNNHILCKWRTCSLNVWACVPLDCQVVQRWSYIACIWKAYLLNVSPCVPWENWHGRKNSRTAHSWKTFFRNGWACVS